MKTKQEVGPEANLGYQGRAVRVLALNGKQASHSMSQNMETIEDVTGTLEFEVGDLLLVAHGKTLDASVKWQAYKLGFHGPFAVKQAKHFSIAWSHTSGIILVPLCKHIGFASIS